MHDQNGLSLQPTVANFRGKWLTWYPTCSFLVIILMLLSVWFQTTLYIVLILILILFKCVSDIPCMCTWGGELVTMRKGRGHSLRGEVVTMGFFWEHSGFFWGKPHMQTLEMAAVHTFSRLYEIWYLFLTARDTQSLYVAPHDKNALDSV